MSADPKGAPVVKSQPSELRLRVLSAIVMVVAAVLALWLGGWPFALFWIAAACVAADEWQRIVGEPGAPAARAAAVVGAFGAGLFAHQEQLLLAVGTVAAMGMVVFSLSEPGRRREASAGVAYAAMIAAGPIIVRAAPEAGAALIAWCFAVVWATDVAAYFTGRTIGGPKLWPAVSPKKTWSGALGGALAGVVAGLLVAWASRRLGVAWPMGFGMTALAALLASAAGQAGDLFESALKRRHDVKDSGTLIPGHGGVLDRLDAFVVVVGLVALGVLLFL
jgi:phosphatidate cytidylyltransferase